MENKAVPESAVVTVKTGKECGEMKNIKKLMALMMAAALMLNGCGSKPAKESSTAGVGKNLEEDFITKNPEELTIFIQPFGANVKMEDMKIYQKAAELTNVSVKQINSQNNSSITEAFSLMMSTGDLPDIVVYVDPLEINRYGAEGAFAPLAELIDEYAPNYKKFLADNDYLRKAITTTDGVIYGLRSANTSIKASQGWEIRQDWLDKLGLLAPKTIDELHDILKAFAEKDPNGNGQKDEVPYFNRLNGEAMDPLLALWDAQIGFYIGNDGKVHYGPYEQETKTAYSNIAKWYKEGLIDKEIFTRGGKARDELFGKDIGGCTHDWFGSTCQFNDMMKATNTNFKLTTFLPPAGKEVKSRDGVSSNTTIAISQQSTKKEIAMKYIDFWFGETGSRLINYGIEGEQYDMVDGVPTFKDSVLHNSETVLAQLYKVGAQTGMLFKQDFNYEKQWLNSEALKGIEDYEKADNFEERFPVLNYTDEEQKERSKLMTDVSTYVSEKTQKWVLGAEDCESSFDEYIKGLEGMGVKRLIEITQTAYDRYQAE